jgi:hypothetical protein
VARAGRARPTYSLGVILERLLLDTDLRLIILDPNGDYVRLGELRGDVPDAVAERMRRTSLRVLRPGDGPDALRMRFPRLTPHAKAAILQIDPLKDREEVFGFAPPASPAFRQGEMLLAGAFVPAPIVAQVGARRTQEGGSDVSVPLRPSSQPLTRSGGPRP